MPAMSSSAQGQKFAVNYIIKNEHRVLTNKSNVVTLQIKEYQRNQVKKISQINIVIYIQMKIQEALYMKLGFTDKKKAKQSLSKIRNSEIEHMLTKCRLIAMSQRAK